MPLNHQENIIELKDVSFAYNKHTVLKGVNLVVHRGDYLGLIGGNGSGKTTLIKIVLGLLKADTGSVRLFGQEQKDFKDWQKVGYVPQKVTSFDANFPATVWEVVLMGRYGIRGLFQKITEDDREKTRQALERVRMWEYRDQRVGDLSGGQQQRVFIARALAGEPNVLFLDEPTVGVEKDIKETFYALLQELNRELKLTIILVTHDVENVAHEAMHVACLDCTIFFHDSVDAYFKDTHKVVHPHA
jgi:zinc transport system ATP-binding protein